MNDPVTYRSTAGAVLSPGAHRMARHHDRRRKGLRCVTIEWEKESMHLEVGPMPDDPDALVADYFEAADDECYSIEKLTVQPSPSHTSPAFEGASTPFLLPFPTYSQPNS
jgi:hypothetical protein